MTRKESRNNWQGTVGITLNTIRISNKYGRNIGWLGENDGII